LKIQNRGKFIVLVTQNIGTKM